MTSISSRIAWKICVALVFFLSGFAGLQAQAVNESAGTLNVISRPAYASAQQPQEPTQDKSKLAADRARALFQYADRLRNEGSAESLKKAVEMYGQALHFFRAAADRRGEAGALGGIGLVYYELGENQKALDYYNQSLPLMRATGDRVAEAITLSNLGLAYRDVGEKAKALDFFNQTLAVWAEVGNRFGLAATLSNIGGVFHSLGEKQKAIEYYNKALLLRRDVGDRAGKATIFTNLGFIHGELGEKQKALEYHNKALCIRRAAGDSNRQAAALNSIGKIYEDLGEREKADDYYNQALAVTRAAGVTKSAPNLNGAYEYTEAGRLRVEGSAESLGKAVAKYGEALLLFRGAANRRGEALVLNDLGLVYDALDEKQKAIEHFNQALLLERTLGNCNGEAKVLNNLGKAYSDLGALEKARDHYSRALPLWEAADDRRGRAVTLGNVGVIHSSLGEFQKALECFTEALSIWRALVYREGEATTLNNIGIVYNSLGEKQKALEYNILALSLWRAVGNRAGEGTTLSNIGLVYDGLGEKQKALDYYNQALPPTREVGDRSGEARTLSNIGMVYSDLGKKQNALDHFNRALTLMRSVGDRAAEGATLSNLGKVYYAWGQKQKAFEYYSQALPLRRAADDRDGEANTLRDLMDAWKGDNPALAIFYGKQAVNTYQQVRGNIVGLDRVIQNTFLRSKEEIYRELANVLISAGRLAEAQQVLGLLKEEEYFEFVRRDGEASLKSVRISFTPAETELEKRYAEVANRIADIGAQRSTLLALKRRTPKQDQRLSELEGQLEMANRAFQKFLDQLEAELQKTRPNNNDVVALRDAQAFQRTLRELNAIALFTIVGSDKYRLILITPDVQKAYEYEISETDLNKKVFALREVLQDPKANPLPLTQELHRILIGPELARDIAQTKNQTILWSLDGALRYLPIAALHDGQKYLVETYRNVVITLASRVHLNDPVSAKWQALGLGVSKPEVIAREGSDSIFFGALPGVRDELSGIVRDKAGRQNGILPGRVMLDAEFTAEAMGTALRLQGNEQPFKLVHIASHFNFEPGNETKSFLLLGGGKTLTLAQLKSMSQIFSGVELLTLSACNTATGGEREGKEVEGFAVLAQRQGAQAIVASLWPVADTSTSQLMRSFYRLRDEHLGMAKAEAMRQAQLRLLRAEADSDARFAHPYYWAPFIIIGNWR